MMRRQSAIWNPVLFVLAAALLSSCADNSDVPQLGEVHGTVKLNGDPLPNATVEFYPEQGAPSYGETNEEGYYELRYNDDYMGAVVGKHTVKITTYKQTAPGEEPVPEKVPAKYNQYDQFNLDAELIEEVKPGENSINFDLKKAPGDEVKKREPTGC